MSHIVNSCYVVLLQENHLHHDLWLFFLFHGKTEKKKKKLRKAMFLSNRLHCYALSLAFHWWLVKWTCHYELLRTRSKSFKDKYYHCSVHTACTKINRSQQKFSILIHYFQADTFIPYGEHGWHDKYQMFEIHVFTPVLQVWLLSYPGNVPQNKQTKQKAEKLFSYQQEQHECQPSY